MVYLYRSRPETCATAAPTPSGNKNFFTFVRETACAISHDMDILSPIRPTSPIGLSAQQKVALAVPMTCQPRGIWTEAFRLG